MVFMIEDSAKNAFHLNHEKTRFLDVKRLIGRKMEQLEVKRDPQASSIHGQGELMVHLWSDCHI